MSEYDETSSDSGFDDSSIEESDSSNVDSFNEDTNDNSNDFEIGGHNDMSLEEVQDYQNDGWNDVEQMRGETWDEREPGAELSHQGFMMLKINLKREL